MEDVPSKSSVLHLGNLPVDIVRVIVPMVGAPVKNLRLISPTWNAVALEHLTDRRNYPYRLEYVEFASERGSSDVTASIRWKSKTNELKRAIMDEHFNRLTTGWTRGEGGVYGEDWHNEAESPLMRTKVLSFEDFLRAPLKFLFMCLLISVLWAVRNSAVLMGEVEKILPIANDPIFYYLVPIGLLGFLFFYPTYPWFYIRPRLEEHRHCLTFLFNRCSFIKEMRLINLDQSALKVIQASLGNVHVSKMEIFGMQCNNEMKTTIVDLVRRQGLYDIDLYVSQLDGTDLSNFLLDVFRSTTDMCNVHVYERITWGSPKNLIFGHSKDFWITMQQQNRSLVRMDIDNESSAYRTDHGAYWRRLSFRGS